eukprot:scaffold116325_cov19-Tisochrysis_lutea.AAC.2
MCAFGSTAEKCTACGQGEWLMRPMKGAKHGQVSCLEGWNWTCTVKARGHSYVWIWHTPHNQLRAASE